MEPLVDHHPISLDVNGDGTDNPSSQKGSGSLTHRRHTHLLTKEDKEKMKHFESLDFRLIDNVIWRHYQNKATKIERVSKNFGKWVIAFFIGVGVGLIVYTIKEAVDKIQELKFGWVAPYLDGRQFIAFLIYYACNLALGLTSCLVVILTGPVVSSSGIPEVKGYLNGIRIRKAFNVKTLIGKVVSLILSFSSGLVLGPEGPMFHIGSTLGASLGQLKSKTFNLYSSLFWRYQNDVDKRDFISCGAAAGIAAAFGAPIGGVLFTMEEGSSFWSQTLTWRTFFACLIATFTANLFLQNFHIDVKDYGVLTFGFGSNLYSYPQLIPFLIIGIIGGLLGALFVHVNVRLSKLRMQYLGSKKLHRLAEVAAFVTVTSIISFCLPFFFPCRATSDIGGDNSIEGDSPPEVVEFNCGEGKYNDMASVFYTTFEQGLRLMYSRNTDIFHIATLPIFGAVFFLLGMLTSGLYVASGIFIPMMVVGAAVGRFIGLLVQTFYDIDSSICAVIGSAALMAGSMRLTISLVVIIVELTEGTQYLLPIILVVMVGKWVGDYFNESIYEHLIELKHIPYLPYHASHQTDKLLIKDVMVRNVLTIPPLLRVRDALRLLRATKHNAFPVVMSTVSNDNVTNGFHTTTEFNPRASTTDLNRAKRNSAPPAESKKFVGMMLRNQLVILLQRRMFGTEESFPPLDVPPAEIRLEDLSYIPHKDFTIALSKNMPELASLPIVEEDQNSYIDVRPYMNLSAVTVSKWFSFTETYNLFRSNGLRHLVVVDEKNEVVGICTRKDFL